MGEIMTNLEFLKTVTKEELHDSWGVEQRRRIVAEDRVRHLEESNKHLELELEKFQRWYYEERKKNEHINS